MTENLKSYGADVPDDSVSFSSDADGDHHYEPFEPVAAERIAAPAFVSWGDFKMSSKGLYTFKVRAKDDAKAKGEWVCAAFEIIGICRDPHGFRWGKWLHRRDSDGRVHTRHVTDAALQGESGPLCAMLADEGLNISKGQQRALVAYLLGCDIKSRVTIVDRTGCMISVGIPSLSCQQKPSGRKPQNPSFWTHRQTALTKRAVHLQTGRKASARCRAATRLRFCRYRRRWPGHRFILLGKKAAASIFSAVRPKAKPRSLRLGRRFGAKVRRRVTFARGVRPPMA